MQAQPEMYKLKLGQQAPAFSLQGVDNNIYTWDSLTKDYTVIIFMCNHCPYVLAYIERIKQLAADFPMVQFVGINANDPTKYPQDSFANMQTFVTEKEITFPYLFDETQEVAKAFHGLLTPHVMVFDKEHKLVYNGSIDDNCEEASAVKENWLHNALTSVTNSETPIKQETPCTGCSIKWKE
jgi:peroxiredoxin